MEKTNNIRPTISDIMMMLVSCFFLLLTYHRVFVYDSSAAAISDRVIAFVDDQAITLSDFENNTTIRYDCLLI